MIKISLLSENYARRRNMLGEHGLSIWVEKDDKNILFDTGQSDVFSLNAKHIGLDISKADMLVLSHGHYDHTGGVPAFCRINNHAPIYIHPDAFKKRYYGEGKQGRNIGIPWSKKGKSETDIATERLLIKNGPIKINESIIISGEITRTATFEDVPQNFYLDNGYGIFSQDMIVDEQMLIVKGNSGVYVFVGCSHAGIINCIQYAQTFFPNGP